MNKINQKREKEIVLILENIRSVHNVGSIFRTADGFGITKIYLTGFTPEPIDRFGRLRTDFKKTALGAEKIISWKKQTTKETIRDLKLSKFKIIAIEQDPKSKPLDQLKLEGNTAIILGSETVGIEQETLKMSDEIFEIKMRGSKESLNVSVVAGMAIYQLFR